jgi:hypothetical protein
MSVTDAADQKTRREGDDWNMVSVIDTVERS